MRKPSRRLMLAVVFGMALFSKIYAIDDYWLHKIQRDDYSLIEDVQKNKIECAHKDDSPYTNKTCNARGDILNELSFTSISSWMCFMYLQPSLWNTSAAPIKFGTCYFKKELQDVPARCLILNETVNGEILSKCYQVHEDIPQVANEIRRTLVSDIGLKKWAHCSRQAVKCCEETITESITDNNTCPAMWDGWSCWDKVFSGHTSEGLCPDYAYSNTGPSCHHYSYKECFDNSTWNQSTDYSTCSITPRLITRLNFHIACLSLSIIIALPAVVVLFSYRKLRVRRLALHRNLLISIIFRNIIVIIVKSTILMEELTSASGDTVMSRNNWPCKMLSVIDKLASSATFTCMLIDGFFLHRMIVTVFKRELKILIVHAMGAVATVVPVLIWIILMVTLNDSFCWMVYTVPNIQWVLDAPRIAMLIVNIGLLIDIMRVLLTKLSRSENAHNLSTAKATLFLIPLFGVQFMITAWRPRPTSCDLEQAYYFFTYIMDGLQGIMVAVLYCYFNKEVHNLLTLTYKKTETAVTRFRSEVRDRRPTMSNVDMRRETCSTVLDRQRISNRQIYEPAAFLEEDPVPTKHENNIVTLQRDESTDEIVKTPQVFEPITSIEESPIPTKRENNMMTLGRIEPIGDIVLLNDPYKPSNDGIIDIEFENDTYEKDYDKLRRYSGEKNIGNINESIQRSSIKPRFPRAHKQLDNAYENYAFAENSSDGGESNTNNVEKNENKFGDYNEVIYLTRPLEKSDTNIILPDILCDSINVNDNTSIDENEHLDINKDNMMILEHQQEKHFVEEKKADQEEKILEATNIDRDTQSDLIKTDVSPEVSDYNEIETIDEINAEEIFDQIKQKYDDHIYENMKPVIVVQDDEFYEDIVFDPQKFCPNRADDDDIIFV